MSKYQAKNFKTSAKFAIRGLRLALRSQRNVKKHLKILISMLALAIILKFDFLHLAVFLLTAFLTIVAELFNSAIEFALDAYFKNKYSNMVKMAKDISAGAVMLMACVNVLVFILLFVDIILKKGLHFLI